MRGIWKQCILKNYTGEHTEFMLRKRATRPSEDCPEAKKSVISVSSAYERWYAQHGYRMHGRKYDPKLSQIYDQAVEIAKKDDWTAFYDYVYCNGIFYKCVIEFENNDYPFLYSIWKVNAFSILEHIKDYLNLEYSHDETSMSMVMMTHLKRAFVDVFSADDLQKFIRLRGLMCITDEILLFRKWSVLESYSELLMFIRKQMLLKNSIKCLQSVVTDVLDLTTIGLKYASGDGWSDAMQIASDSGMSFEIASFAMIADGEKPCQSYVRTSYASDNQMLINNCTPEQSKNVFRTVGFQCLTFWQTLNPIRYTDYNLTGTGHLLKMKRYLIQPERWVRTDDRLISLKNISRAFERAVETMFMSSDYRIINWMIFNRYFFPLKLLFRLVHYNFHANSCCRFWRFFNHWSQFKGNGSIFFHRCGLPLIRSWIAVQSPHECSVYHRRYSTFCVRIDEDVQCLSCDWCEVLEPYTEQLRKIHAINHEICMSPLWPRTIYRYGESLFDQDTTGFDNIRIAVFTLLIRNMTLGIDEKIPLEIIMYIIQSVWLLLLKDCCCIATYPLKYQAAEDYIDNLWTEMTAN